MIEDAANESIKKKIITKTIKKKWYDKKCRELNSWKTEAKNKLLNRHTRSNLQHYKELRTAAKKEIRKKKRKFLNAKICEVEAACAQGKAKVFYKELKTRSSFF